MRKYTLIIAAVIFAAAALLIDGSINDDAVEASHYVDVSAGGTHTCALTTGSGVQCWGEGFGNSPVELEGLNSGIAAISAGWDHSCAITNAGGLKCWGENNYGQLGDGSNIDSMTPVDVFGLTVGVTAVSAGLDGQTCAIVVGGLKCWGKNERGQLGDGSNTNTNTPVDVVGLGSGVASVSSGHEATCAVTDTGAAKCWGSGQLLGNGGNANSNMPVDVSGLNTGVTAISAGAADACAIVSGGVKCWGSRTLSNVPVDIFGLETGVTQIGSGFDHICALLGDAAKCWGQNYFGQLGNAGTVDSTVPVDVFGLGSGVTNLSVGGEHSCAIVNGSVRCWGANFLGHLGNGSDADSTIPVDTIHVGSPNLIAHFTFDDGTAVDDSGNANDGTISGALPSPGKVGAKSLGFDGVDDHVDVGPILNYPTESVSVAAWFSSDALANCGSFDCRIASKATDTSESEHYLMLSTVKIGGDVRLRFRLKAGGTTQTLIASVGNIQNGVWYHVAATYDGATMKLYMDGVEVGSVVKTGIIDLAPAVDFWIGGNPDSPTSRPWEGRIDDVRIYDGALTKDEIAALVELALSPVPTPPPAKSFGSLMSGFAALLPTSDTASPQWFSPVGLEHRGASVSPAPLIQTQTLSPAVDGVGRALAMRSLTPNSGTTPWTFTLHVDGVATSLSCLIPVGASTCDSGAELATIPAGSLIVFSFDHLEQLPTETTITFGWLWQESE